VPSTLWIAMDLERARQLLASERQRLERVLARRASSDDGEEADEQHASNLAADLYQEELDEGLSDDLRLRLAALERAERRLAAGTYGLSIESGEPIPDERLEAWPTAELTAEEERARAPSRRRTPGTTGTVQLAPASPGSELRRTGTAMCTEPHRAAKR
jgi:DnaK suppressor protein